MLSRLLSRTRAGFLAAAAIIALAPLTGGAASARSLEEAKASGAIIVGIQGDNSPWGFIDSAGVQDGFDADIARAFAKSQGVEVKFFPLAVANRIPALTSGKVDALFASMGMTPERAKSVQYSLPYAANQLYVVAAKETKITNAADLAGLDVGVPRSAPMDTNLTAIAPADTNILRFDDDAANIQALLSGQVAAIGANQFYLQRLETARPGVYENKFEIGRLFNGAATRLGEADWNEALNAFLADYMKTDEYKAVYQKWMRIDPPEFPATLEGVPFVGN